MHHLQYTQTWKVTLEEPCHWERNRYTHCLENSTSTPKAWLRLSW
jgi:hypothetical protein